MSPIFLHDRCTQAEHGYDENSIVGFVKIKSYFGYIKIEEKID